VESRAVRRPGPGFHLPTRLKCGRTSRALAGLWALRPYLERAKLSPRAVGTIDHDFFVVFGVRVADEVRLPTGRGLARFLAALDTLESTLSSFHDDDRLPPRTICKRSVKTRSVLRCAGRNLVRRGAGPRSRLLGRLGYAWRPAATD